MSRVTTYSAKLKTDDLVPNQPEVPFNTAAVHSIRLYRTCKCAQRLNNREAGEGE
jgi:hypothetical protein